MCINNLDLMTPCFLQKGRRGISMNEIAYCKPTHVYCSDSCPIGMRGCSHKGFVWQFYLPDKLQFRASNNLLEPIAGIISPWVNILAGGLKEGDYALSMTDSTTSEGWTRKTNFKKGLDHVKASVRIEVVRGHATRYMNHGIR